MNNERKGEILKALIKPSRHIQQILLFIKIDYFLPFPTDNCSCFDAIFHRRRMLNNTQVNDEHIIKTYEEVEAFLRSLVLQLHRRKFWLIGASSENIDNVDEELRFLQTFHRDATIMGCHEHHEFQKLLSELANEAKSLLNSVCCSHDSTQPMHMSSQAVLNQTVTVLIRPEITDFLNLLPSIRKSVVCMTPSISALDLPLIVDSLIRDLEDMMKREDNLAAGEVKGQIEFLYEGLILFKSSVDAVESLQHLEIRELKQNLLQIGQMVYEAEYLLISFSNGEAPPWYLSVRLNYINQEIRLIGTQLQQIIEEYTFGGLEASKYNFKLPPSLPAKTNTVVDHFTVGFKEKEEEVLEKLVGDAKCLQVISIVGMAGLGKTTLARKLYNHSLVNYRFDKISWCVVSQTYLRQSILIDILMQIQSELDKNTIFKMGEAELTERVYKSLFGRRYLIVMDDVWGSNVLYTFRGCFPDNGNGSRILFTSRNKDAALPNNIVYAMSSLSDDQCWELLEKKVFDENGCPPQLLAAGKKIAANCSGLPLAVVVIAGILSTMDRKKTTWEQVGGNLASYIFNGVDHSVMQILELSYKHLPRRLRQCFLYLATFEEDKEIDVGELIRLWIGEGFISKKAEKHAEDAAEEYLMELIDKSLVMAGKRRSDGGVKTCTVHDLLREFCLKRCNEENFIMFGEKYGYEKGIRGRFLGGRISRRYSQQVRSIHGRVSLPADFVVGDLRLLGLLTCDYHRLVPNYRGIEYLVNLTYLTIGEGRGTGSPSISSLLESISSLVKLEHLFVFTNETVCLSPTIVKLRKLRFLRVGGYGARYDEDWNSSSHATNLEYLSNIVIGDRKDEEALRCSLHLRKLKCTSPINLKERMEYRHFDLRFLTKLESLNVVFDIHQMKGIIYPANLKKLTLAKVVLTRKKISMIGGLENLVVLKLERKCMFMGAGEDWDTRDGEFQKLRFLKLQDMEYFHQWNVASSQHFPQLQQLVLCDCSDLRGIPSEIGEIATLQLIELRRKCLDLLVQSARQIQKQQLEMGNEDLRVVMLDIKKSFSLDLDDRR